jgi:hypothetical protein
MSDVPSLADEDTGNFATLNPLDKNASNTLSQANLVMDASANAWSAVRSTFFVNSGKWYWEATLNGSGADKGIIGVSNSSQTLNSLPDANGWGYNGTNGYKYTNSGSSAYGATYTSGDVIGIALDMDAGTLVFYKNGVSQGTAFSSLTGYLSPTFWQYAGHTWSANFGQRPFKYTPPTGYKKLNTYNLPDSSITDGSQYFDVDTWSGDSSATTQIATPFSPDFVWIKNRSNTGGSGAASHMLYDTVRGVQKELQTNLTNAEGTLSTGLNSFDSDGYKPGTSTRTNATGNTYVGWSWRGSDSTAVSNTDGTITSTVSANTTSGFSVVSFNFESTGNKTIGHGLNAIPKMIIMKSRDSSADAWWVYHNSIGASNYLRLNSTNASSANSGVWSTTPTNQVFTIGSLMTTSNYGTSQIAYCFADVEGFSKFGSYTGNSSADGPFVYTGFKPAFVMIKRTDSTGNWLIHDSEREQYNPVNATLYPNLSTAELGSGGLIDFLSNGFKKTYNDSDSNASGATYIYMAFAENPFKNSLGR